MPRFRGAQAHPRGDVTPGSSSASSPERVEYDDTDFFTAQANDSQSSIGISTFREMTVSQATERRQQLPPISWLPAELLITVFSKLGTSDLRTCMLVSKGWADHSVEMLWHRPLCNSWKNLLNIVHSVRKKNAYFPYYDLVKRLNLTNLASEVSDGTIMPLAVCKRVERLTLTNCKTLSDIGVIPLVDGSRNLLALDFAGLESITDQTLLKVASNCPRLQGLNITGCTQMTDRSLCAISENCPSLKRIKLNDCSQLTDSSVTAFANHCRQMLEIDLHHCNQTSDGSITALLHNGQHLRELRLAHCPLITDEAFLQIDYHRTIDTLRVLDLTACDQLTDAAVSKIVSCAPRLRNLVMAKCRRLTDRAITSLAKLGKNLHFLHLGHCSNLTDSAIIELVKACNRIRYIDLACCHRLTDLSVTHLALLPKLRRVGLVKCQAITDQSIYALARGRSGHTGGHAHYNHMSSLERVHLSYCVHLTLEGVHDLLQHCPRLTHLSVTGVQAFLREDITAFCREAPSEFTDHQRDVFCVFSGSGVRSLREHLDRGNIRSNNPGEVDIDIDNENDDDIDVDDNNNNNNGDHTPHAHVPDEDDDGLFFGGVDDPAGIELDNGPGGVGGVGGGGGGGLFLDGAGDDVDMSPGTTTINPAFLLGNGQGQGHGHGYGMMNEEEEEGEDAMEVAGMMHATGLNEQQHHHHHSSTINNNPSMPTTNTTTTTTILTDVDIDIDVVERDYDVVDVEEDSEILGDGED
ncbi:MAG: SCF ubiquitin ligase complex subunit [Watsoniomyces obsoletus]|nr:MAG: SCF ubiquitin ligase complex subunit [Watsoniomyces obsoletus]